MADFPQRTYVVGSSNDVDVMVPNSIKPEKMSAPLPSDNIRKRIPANNGSQSAGGTLLFSIPAQGYLRSQSAYLTCEIVVTVPTNAANKNYTFANSAQSIINRLSVFCNSAQVESINNYDVYSRILLENATSYGYYNYDAKTLEYNAQIVTVAANDTTFTAKVCLPLASGVFTNQKSFPLFLLNSPMLVQVDLNQVGRMFSGCELAVSSVTVQNAFICYENISVKGSWEMDVRSRLAEGSVLNYQMQSVLGLQFNQTGTNITSTNYQAGVGLRSVDGLLLASIDSANISVSTPAANAKKTYSNYRTNNRFFADGRQLNQYDLSTSAIVKAELDACLGSLWDTNTTSVVWADGISATVADGYCVGINTRRFSEVELSHAGIKIDNLNVIVDSGTGSTACTFFLYVIYDQNLKIDASGACNVDR